jgi:hypothetical protein
MIYPITICQDRYGGCYSDGQWLAFNLYPDEVPNEIYSDDITCCSFWVNCELVVGKGNSPEEALNDLYNKNTII